MIHETFPEALARLRSARGFSLRDLGDLVGYSRKTIWNFEKGDRQPHPDTVAALDQALGAEGYLVHLAAAASASRTAPAAMPLTGHRWRRCDAETLARSLTVEGPTPDSALTLAHEWLVTEPPQIYELKAGRHIGADIVDELERRVHQIRLIDDHVGGLQTYALVTAELAATAALLREGSFTDVVARRLLSVISELCQIGGFIAADAGRHSDAHRLYLAGARAAHAAGDAPGAASNLSSLAYQIANVGDPREAVLLARSAHRGARGAATPAAEALLLERVAWAHARAGEIEPAERALDRVDDLFDAHDPETEPVWVYWLNRDEIDVMQGRVWTQLRRPLRAVPTLEQAIRAYSKEDSPREHALYQTWLAESLIHGHEIEHAAAVALDARATSETAYSARVADRLQELRRRLDPYRGNAAVDEFLAA